MTAAEFLGQQNGILIIVCVDHIGLHADVPFCKGDAGRETKQRSDTLQAWDPSPVHPHVIYSSILLSTHPFHIFIHPSLIYLSTHLSLCLYIFIINSSTIIPSIHPLYISIHKFIHFPSSPPSLLSSFVPPSTNQSIYLVDD